MANDMSYLIARRRAEDVALQASSEDAWRLRAELEAGADNEMTVFVTGGHYLTLPAVEGDARGLRRAIAPQCDHDTIDALVGERQEVVEPSADTPLVIEFSHGSSGLGVDVLGQTGLLRRASLGRPPQVEGEALVAELLALAKQFRTDDHFSKGKDAVVLLSSYSRSGDFVGSRRLGVIR